MRCAVERVYNAIDDEERFYVVYEDGGRWEGDALAGPYNSVEAALVIARRIQKNNGVVSIIHYDVETGEKIDDRE